MRLLRTASVRVLDDRDLPEALAVCDRDTAANVFVASRLEATGLDPDRLGAQVWGYYSRGQLESLCYAGATLVPVEATPDAVDAFAERVRGQGRRCSSIVGPVEPVTRLWELLRPYWGSARAVRERQPVMAISSPPALAGDVRVRRVRSEELDLVLPACVAMFTEEVGVPPDAGDGGRLYRARVAELIRRGRAFGHFDGEQVVFKAEIGAVTRHACQVQGVWVHPQCRGQGRATPGMVAVAKEALRTVAPAVTLYVNSFNLPARAAYRRAGFAEVGTFTSILF